MKIHATVELSAKEIWYLLQGLVQLNQHYNDGGSRDYNREDMHEKIQGKLEDAFEDLM